VEKYQPIINMTVLPSFFYADAIAKRNYTPHKKTWATAFMPFRI
jgi:hypothetical protein